MILPTRVMRVRLIAVLGCLTCASFGYGSVCNDVTDIVILIESKMAGTQSDQYKVFRRHQSTAFDIVHRLPMEKDDVRVTVAQFSREKTKMEVIFDNSTTGSKRDSEIYKQKKSEVMDKISEIRPLRNPLPAQGSGNLIGAMKLVSDVILPKILRNGTNGHISNQSSTKAKYSKVILVTIVSGYWLVPDVRELARIFLKLSRQGVLSYVAAYDMKDKPSESVLPLIVSKPQFLILPKIYQSSAVAGHLADAFQVCWKDGPCWPNNPCYYGCDCIEDSSVSLGYKCRSEGSFWLNSDCTKPTPLLTCTPNSMELRLPKHFVTELGSPPTDLDVFSGSTGRKLPDCTARLIDQPSKDPEGAQRASAILQSEGFYYLIVQNVVDNKCNSSFSIDRENDTLKIENTVFKSRKSIPKSVKMDIPVMKMRCLYPATVLKLINLDLKSLASRSILTQNFVDTAQNDAAANDSPSRPGSHGHFPPNYIAWKPINAHVDPDSLNKDAQSALIPLVQKRVGRSPKSRKRSTNQNCGPGYECHCGPYEEGDPCHPKYRTTAKPTTEAIVTTRTLAILQQVQTTTRPPTAKPTTETIVTTRKLTTVQQVEPTTKPPTAKPTTDEVIVTTTTPTTVQQVATATTPPIAVKQIPSTVYNSVIRMKLYEDKALTKEIGPNGARAGSPVFVFVGPDDTADPTSGVCSYVRECWVEVDPDPFRKQTNKSITTLTMVERGCPVNDNALGLRMLNNGNSRSASFSFQSTPLKGFDATSAYFVRCNITVCDCSAGSCGWDCSNPHSRARRSVRDDEFFLEIRLPVGGFDQTKQAFP